MPLGNPPPAQGPPTTGAQSLAVLILLLLASLLTSSSSSSVSISSPLSKPAQLVAATHTAHGSELSPCLVHLAKAKRCNLALLPLGQDSFLVGGARVQTLPALWTP